MGKSLTAILSLLIICSTNVRSQDPGFRPDRTVAERAFDNGDYTTSLKHYMALSEIYRADPVYKYYSGACMVNLKQEPGEAVRLLREAIESESPIRQVPDDAWYYLGRAYHLNGDFSLAIDAYDTYSEKVRRREVREKGIGDLIDQCRNYEGSLEAPILVGGGKEEDIAPHGEYVDAVRDSLALKTEIDEGPGSEYEKLAKEALDYQFKADSVLRLADRYRESLPDLSEGDRQSVRSKILSLEKAGFQFQGLADRKYREAAKIASEKYDEELAGRYLAGGEEADTIARTAARTAAGTVADTTARTAADTTAGTRADTTARTAADTTADTAARTAAETMAGTRADTAAVQPVRPEPVLSLFSDQYSQDKIPVNPELPEGLLYRIQLAAFRNPQQASFFRGLGPISIYRADGSDINFYYAGMFRSKEDADRALVKVKQKGFNDAFVIALMDGSRISLEKAGQLEKQWTHISLFDQDTVIVDKKDQEPPTLVYRVEVLRVKKKVEDDELELLERLADSRAFDIYETATGEYVYLIGKFLTFESAAAYADLLYRNGMKEAKVVAYLGEKEIPVETARKIFELYFEK